MTFFKDPYMFLWAGFSLMSMAGLSVVFVWAWRAGQFRNQDRARYLALWAEVPGRETGAAEMRRRGEQAEDAEVR